MIRLILLLYLLVKNIRLQPHMLSTKYGNRGTVQSFFSLVGKLQMMSCFFSLSTHNLLIVA